MSHKEEYQPVSTESAACILKAYIEENNQERVTKIEKCVFVDTFANT